MAPTERLPAAMKGHLGWSRSPTWSRWRNVLLLLLAALISALQPPVQAGETDPNAESNAGKADGHADCLVTGVFKILWRFFSLAALGLTAGAVKRKRPALFAPLIPLGFILAYQYDMGYGTLIRRMKGSAEDILENESHLLELPQGLPTFELIEKARKAQRKFFIDK